MGVSGNVLLTGGTGFIGKAVLARLLDVPSYRRIYLLVRGNDRATAAERVDKILTRMFPAGRLEEVRSRVIAIEGNIEKPGLGICENDVARLKLDLHQILHIGASTDFGAPLDESRLTNVEGTRHALDLAVRLRKAGTLKRFDYVSTAYVAGTTAGVVTEDDLDRGQEFANNYEQSKYEAELLVREYKSFLPIAIYRPSIVVGDSNHGHTPHFKVLYWPLLLLSKNLLPFFACNQRAHLDVVPVDFVADGLVALMQREGSVGRTFMLSAGLGHEINIRELLRDAYQYASIKERPVVPLWTFNLIMNTPLKKLFHEGFWDAVEMARPYFAYFKGTGVRFDASRTLEVLRGLGVQSPRWSQYKREVLGYCVASRWGRKPPMPEYAYYLPVSGKKELWRSLEGEAEVSLAAAGNATPVPVA